MLLLQPFSTGIKAGEVIEILKSQNSGSCNKKKKEDKILLLKGSCDIQEGVYERTNKR